MKKNSINNYDGNRLKEDHSESCPTTTDSEERRPGEGAVRRAPQRGFRVLALTCFGLGFLRPAPGTWGSIPSAALAWAILVAGASSGVYVVALVAVGAAASWVCVAWGQIGEAAFGSKDPHPIVIDEVAGQCVALLALTPALAPTGALQLTGFGAWFDAGLAVSACFVLFRIFDILKPFPANASQALAGGVGVLVDDLIAGVYAGIVTAGGLWTLTGLGAI